MKILYFEKGLPESDRYFLALATVHQGRRVIVTQYVSTKDRMHPSVHGETMGCRIAQKLNIDPRTLDCVLPPRGMDFEDWLKQPIDAEDLATAQ